MIGRLIFFGLVLLLFVLELLLFWGTFEGVKIRARSKESDIQEPDLLNNPFFYVRFPLVSGFMHWLSSVLEARGISVVEQAKLAGLVSSTRAAQLEHEIEEMYRFKPVSTSS
jgi:hypothetical protein